MSEEHPDGGATSGTPGSDPETTPTPPTPPPPPAAPSPYAPPSPYAAPTPPEAPQPYAGQPPAGDYGAPAAGYPYGDTNILPAEPPRGGGRRGLILGAGALVLALVAAVGVYAATQVGGGGTQPEEVIPATAFAFAKIDLDPAADQKVAIREFASKFPSVPKPSGDDDIIDSLLRRVFEESDESEKPECKANYDADIKPWLGDRVAVAGVIGADGKPQPLLALQAKDEAKARAAFKKLLAPGCEGSGGEDLKGLEIHKGYALLGKTPADVAAVIKAADDKPLKDAPNFTSDVAKLDGNQVMVAWVDVAKSFEIASKESPQLGTVPNSFTRQFKGRLVFGMHLETDYAEWYGRTIDNDSVADVVVGSGEHLSTLPKSTVAAVAVNGLEQQITKMLDQVGAGGVPVDDFLAQFEAQAGLRLREDVLPIFGEKTAIALGSVPQGPDAKVGLTSKVKDPDAARTVGQKLAQLGSQFGVPIESDVDGNTFYLATGGYLTDLKGDKGLGESPTFQRAMGDLGDQLASAVYVDLGQLLTLAKDEEEYKDLQHLSAFGMSAGKDGKDAYFRARLVVK
jgi:hypothetical protein